MNVMLKGFRIPLILLFAGGTFAAQAQTKTLSLKEAVQTALDNYGIIRAKANYARASRANLEASRRDMLPDLSLSAQQDYGTINGQSGPLYGYRGLSVASGGPSMESQNWTGAFGALYLANFNWDFYSFGKVRQRINIYRSSLVRDENDLEQEKFQQQIRVSTAYLNLLAAQRIVLSQQTNLERAIGLQAVVIARTKGGLNAGVDSSLANAEVSAAKITLLRARDTEQDLATQLAQLMGIVSQNFKVDTVFVTRIPASITDSIKSVEPSHPLLRFYKSRIEVSNSQTNYLRTFYYPTFSFFSIFQERGSGFKYNYGTNSPEAYTGKYLQGIQPQRGNFLLGLGLVWNLTTPLRVSSQVTAQRFTSLGLQNEYELVTQQLQNQLLQAESRIRNSLASFAEAPIQVKAARDAYNQKTVLYRNGLANIVDATQALYAINRAETDRDIAFTNVWQALLLKAAATGDFTLFASQL